MENIFVSLFAICLLANFTFAQSVTISPNGTSSIFDINSTTNGFLLPRMSIYQRGNLIPTTGLMIFCTDCPIVGRYCYDGDSWKSLVNTNSGNNSYSIGQQAQGGTVMWLDETGQHGLVAAPEDITLPNGITWGIGSGVNDITSCVASGIYAGQNNTNIILSKFGWGNYAAFLCKQNNYNNYGDWYLPSLYELQIMYNNREYISGLNLGAATYYWSSTENANGMANLMFFALGETYATNKNQSFLLGGILFRVRAIRRF